MPGWEQLGMQAAGTAANAAMGLILQGANDRRQLRQQGKLQELQIKGNKQLTDYNFQKQMEMWRNTNYPAQMAMLKAAGLNPALIYENAGPGAQTSIAQGNLQGATAPTGGGEIQQMIAMGLTRELQQAQIENIKAQTQKTKVETTKTAGVDTTLAETTIDKLKQDIKSQQTQNALTEVQTAIAAIQEHIAAETQNMQISKIASATKIIANDAAISDATRDTIITTIKRESLQVYLQNQLLKSQKTLTDEQVNKTKQEIANLIANIIQTRKHLQIEDLKARIMENQAFREAQNRGDINIDDLTKNVGLLLNPANLLKPTHNPVGFKIP